MKKVCIFLAMMTFAVAMLTACGSKNNSTNSTTTPAQTVSLNMYHPCGGEMKLGQYKGLTYEKKAITVTEEEIDHQIELLLSEYPNYTKDDTRDNTEVKSGDVLNIDYIGKVADVAFHSSEMERNSVDAERASVDLKCAEYMMDHVGEKFPGTVSGACPAGIFVKLENTIEGMVPFSSLNEYFEFDERKLEARGSRGTVYRIGRKVNVQVASADPLTHHIDFSIVE